ncbi:pentapeptide repeat-containing protein [Actinoplanes sp. NPDC051633]|uniref:pentapeptide repeat-containing protein n=1 Tax=Actinoplanes sp. NPDC051633 TaxID=3155670 RepID=UPI00343D2E63
MRNVWRPILIILVSAFAMALVVLLPLQMVQREGLNPEQWASHVGTARTAVVQSLAGIGLLGGLFYAGSTLRLNREGQITDRFGSAVEHLGAQALETRIGGLYALERIMRDSRADHEPIVEIVSAFVREHATFRGEPEPGANPSTFPGPPTPGVAPLRADIQAAITILGRRPRRKELGRLDLRGVDLRGVRAHAANLRNAVLLEARLDHADLGKAELAGARLRKGSLRSAWLRAADLRNSSLRHVDLRGANLSEARLQDADLTHAETDG